MSRPTRIICYLLGAAVALALVIMGAALGLVSP